MAYLNRKGHAHPFQSACASRGVTMIYSKTFLVCWKVSQDFFGSFLSIAFERSEYPTVLWRRQQGDKQPIGVGMYD